jgi:hypothetical protein
MVYTEIKRAIAVYGREEVEEFIKEFGEIAVLEALKHKIPLRDISAHVFCFQDND